MHLLQEDIPPFIRSSLYLQTLLSEGPWPADGLEIPDGCAKKDLVSNDADLLELLITIRFWLVPEVAEHIEDLPKYALMPVEPNDFNGIVAEFGADIPFVRELLEISLAEDKVERACCGGMLKILQFLCEELNLSPTDPAGISSAKGGHLECLQYLHSRGLAISHHIYRCACEYGQLACMQYLTGITDEWVSQAAHYSASSSGNIDCIKYGVELNTHFDHVHGAIAIIQRVAQKGHLECLQRLFEELGWNSEDCIVWAMRAAAEFGHLPVLEYCIMKYTFNRTRLHEVMTMAVHGGHVNCISWMRKQGCRYDAYYMKLAVAGGHVEATQFLHEDGCPWDETACYAAAAAGSLACLQCIHEHGCPWQNNANHYEEQDGELISVSAARAPTTNCLEYVVSHGAILTQSCAQSGVTSRCLATLQFLYARGIVWSEEDAALAAGMGWLEGLTFLHEIGTPWGETTTEAVANSGNMPVLLYALHHGCPWSDFVLWKAKSMGADAHDCVDCVEGSKNNHCSAFTTICNSDGVLDSRCKCEIM